MKTHEFEIQRGESTLEFRSVHADIRIKIATKMPRRGRRALLLLIFKAIKPALPYIYGGCATHSDGNVGSTNKDFTRPLSLRQAPGAHPGSILRLQRLKLGWTLQQLADRAQLNAQSLGRIERGQATPRPHTVARIQQAFSINWWE